MRYVCRICGYIYDESKEKTPFSSLPDTWKCPLCGAGKQDFAPEKGGEATKTDAGGVAAGQTAAAPGSAADFTASFAGEGDLKELSAGQLSALCSNLGRGCEKQYMPREAGWFRELADYFASAVPPVSDAGVERIAAMLQGDIDSYSGVRAAADAASDRGAARAAVWGEKVTRMLYSLVSRYLREGEAMLENTGVWVCTVCGFVYVGDEAPALCPVCRVPSWKFEKIEGRA